MEDFQKEFDAGDFVEAGKWLESCYNTRGPYFCGDDIHTSFKYLQICHMALIVIWLLTNRVGHFCNLFIDLRSPVIFWCHGTQ